MVFWPWLTSARRSQVVRRILKNKNNKRFRRLGKCLQTKRRHRRVHRCRNGSGGSHGWFSSRAVGLFHRTCTTTDRTLSGITTDQTDARVPGAKVVVTNEATGDIRATKTDAQGFFSVTALIPGTYKVTISAKSFASWEDERHSAQPGRQPNHRQYPSEDRFRSHGRHGYLRRRR